MILLATQSTAFASKLQLTTVNTTNFDPIARFKEMLAGINLEVLLVNESYEDDDGVSKKFIPDGFVSMFSLTGNNSGNPKERLGEVISSSSSDAGLAGAGKFKTGYWSNTISTQDPVTTKIIGGASFMPMIQYPDRLVCMYVKAGDPGWDAPTI
jgi:hypothetical protein